MNYPYSTATGTIQKILAKIQTVGQPPKLDANWMASIGFKKTSEQRMIAILKFLGFAEKDGTPTNIWLKFRSNKTGKEVLGDAIKSAYSELYQTYPNAHELDKEELTHFFTTKTTAGSLALSHTVNTFKNLADYAEFKESSASAISENTSENTSSSSKELSAEGTDTSKPSDFGNQLSKQFKESKSGLTINLNIQLTVPETTDEKVYDKFFESLKKHLLS
jgi:hypothetical protein